MLISENLSGYVYIFDAVMTSSTQHVNIKQLDHVNIIATFGGGGGGGSIDASILTRRLIACRHSILVYIDYDDKDFR